MKKILLFIFTMINGMMVHAQLVDTAIMLKDVINIDSLNRLSMGREENHKYFRECQPHINPSFSGTDTVYFETHQGEIKVLVEYKNGQKIKSTGYYDNNNKYKEANFNGNTLHGINIVYYKNGQKEYQRYYENGKKVYPEIMYYEDGSIESVHDADEISDKWKVIRLYRSGKTEAIITSIDSLVDMGHEEATLSKHYYENGMLMEDVIYNAGVQNFLAYYENGQKCWEGKIVGWAGYQVGKWTDWHKNGQLKREYIFHDSIPNYRQGTWRWWDENGNLIKQEIYKDNELIESKEFLPVENKKK